MDHVREQEKRPEPRTAPPAQRKTERSTAAVSPRYGFAAASPRTGFAPTSPRFGLTAPAAAERAAAHGVSAGSAVGQLETPGTRSGSRPPAGAANRTGLPDRLKKGVEALSGFALDDVRVHYKSARPAQLQAAAYTQGAEIHVAPGRERHLPHEAWHVVQQKQGRVRPTLQMKGTAVNDHPGLEAEADAMGERASRTAESDRPLEGGVAGPPVAQLYWLKDDDGKTDWIDGYCGPPLIMTDAIHAAADGHPRGHVWVLPAQQAMEERVAAPASYKYEEPAEFAHKRGKQSRDSGKGEASSSSKAAEAVLTLAQKEKAEQIKDYLALIPHLAGEGGGKAPLKGGHLLEEMKKKHKNVLRLTGTPDKGKPWEGWWSDGAAEAKWSSFFPAPWTNDTLVTALWKSSKTKKGRELPGGIEITKQGDTFFAWVHQTLVKRPATKDMPLLK